MHFGCTNCCLVPIVTNRCYCARDCPGSEVGVEMTVHGSNEELLAAYNLLLPRTEQLLAAAIAECEACDFTWGLPPMPFGEPSELSGWLCGDVSGLIVTDADGVCPDRSIFEPSHGRNIVGHSGRSASISSLWTATTGVAFFANANARSKVCFVIAQLPIGFSMRTWFGVEGIRIRYSVDGTGIPLFGQYLSAYDPDAFFFHPGPPHPPICTFTDYSIGPCAIGYGLADSIPCEGGGLPTIGRGPMAELLNGTVVKEGDLRPSMDNRQRIFNFDTTSDAWNIVAEDGRQIWFLAVYPEPVWVGNTIAPDVMPWAFGQKFDDPHCVTFAVDFLNADGAVLGTG